MNPDQNTNNNSSPNNGTTWLTKARYVGTGLVIGVIIAPVLRELLSKIQPKVDELLENMTGKTEEYAERASDLLHKAKEQVRNSDTPSKKKKWPHAECATESHEGFEQEQSAP